MDNKHRNPIMKWIELLKATAKTRVESKSFWELLVGRTEAYYFFLAISALTSDPITNTILKEDL